MLTFKYCTCILSILFAWMNTVTAFTTATEQVMDYGLRIINNRVSMVNFLDSRDRGWRISQLYVPLNYNIDRLLQESGRIFSMLNSYNTHPSNVPACANDCESKMGDKLQKIIDANKQAGIADKNKFTEITKEFCDDFHSLVKEIVNDCQSSDEKGLAIIEIDLDKLNDMYTALLAVVDRRSDNEFLKDFQFTYNSIVRTLNNLMAFGPNEVNHEMLVKRFKNLLESVKPHMNLFYHLYSVICEIKVKKDDKTRQDGIVKRVQKYDRVINELTQLIYSGKIEEEGHSITTIKQFISFFNDLRMTFRFLDQNTYVLSNIYVNLIKKNIETAYIAKIAEDNKNNPVTKKLNYDDAKADEKNEMNLRLYMTDQSISNTSS